MYGQQTSTLPVKHIPSPYHASNDFSQPLPTLKPSSGSPPWGQDEHTTAEAPADAELVSKTGKKAWTVKPEAPIPFLILFSRQAAVPLVSSHLCRCCHISWHPGRRQLEPSGSGWKARGADGRRSQPAARAPQTAGQVPSVVSGTPSAQLAAMP